MNVNFVIFLPLQFLSHVHFVSKAKWNASISNPQNRMEEAIESYSKCITLDKAYARAYKARASIELSLERYEDALSDFSYSYMLDIVKQPNNQQTPEGMDECIQALAKRDTEKELERRRTDPEYKPSLPSKAFISFYFSTIHSEKSTELNPEGLSEDVLTRRIENFPEEGETKTKGDLLLMRGGLLKGEQRYVQAYEDFKAAADPVNECGDLNQAKMEMATFLSLSGCVKEACLIAEELYNASYRTVNMLVKFASWLQELNDPRSEAVFDEVISLYPKEVDGYFQRGQMHYIHNEIEKSYTVSGVML